MSNLNINTNNAVALNTQNLITMTSQEIATLVEARHDNVKRTVERLVDGGIIQLPPLEEVRNHLGQMVANYIFSGEQGKRDTTIIVAQLSPQFLGAVVDRWIELEKQMFQPQLPNFLDPAAAAIAWATEYKAKQEAETKLIEANQQIEVMQPTVDAYELIAGRKGVLKFQDAYKLFNGMKLKEMKGWMHSKKWLYYDRHGNEAVSNTYVVNGYLAVKVSERYKPQIKVTYKGIAAMARQMKIELDINDFE